MSEYDGSRSDTTSNDTLDDTVVGSADTSLIGKVKSRVSSIFPNSLSKWFSPSTKANNNNNDSINGAVNNNNNNNSSSSGSSGGSGTGRGGGLGPALSGRRRRRIELEDEDDDDGEDDDAGGEEENDDEDDETAAGGGAFNDSALRNQRRNHRDDDDDDDSDDSNQSDDLMVVTSAATKKLPSVNVPRYRVPAQQRQQTTIAASGVGRQPPSKRSRFSSDVSHVRGTPLIQRQPLLASTPTAGGHGNARANAHQQPHLYTHMNLYGYQNQKDPAYDFNSTIDGRMETTTTAALPIEGSGTPSSVMSSRRSLKIPASTPQSGLLLPSLKRQSLTGTRSDEPLIGRNHQMGTMPTHTSTTILEIENCDDDDDDNNDENDNIQGVSRQQRRSLGDEEEDPSLILPEPTRIVGKFNGCGDVATTLGVPNKRQRLITKFNGTEHSIAEEEEVIDTASESSDGIATGSNGRRGGAGGPSVQRNDIAGGLFGQQSLANSRNGSRTSSIGNGLNFYSHLEGRKSLFSGAGHGQNASALNNSTLSLTSLNRRQFNASIYGSTSALSDSRLLNTYSPFYKGRTTYGGAAAYNKYGTLASAAASGAGAGASASMRITPTLIRPTSSLSTLSSSNNSLATAGNTQAGAGPLAADHQNSAISSTAKRILDLINDFTTPLSEAKKMASNIKSNQQQQHVMLPQMRSRLNETDLNVSRGMRLSQVRTPYVRPHTVRLQTTHINGKPAAAGAGGYLPPVRELQVPSMTQLLQMKKLQNTTERSRQIAAQNASAEYTVNVPEITQQQKHTNKMKSQKVSSAARLTGSRTEDMNSPALAPVNLPNIAFPLMQSVPKIDITLPSSPAVATKAPTIPTTMTSGIASSKTDFKFGTPPTAAKTSVAFASTTSANSKSSPGSSNKTMMFAYNPTTNADSKILSNNNKNSTLAAVTAKTAGSASYGEASPPTSGFKFSVPLHVQGGTPPATPTGMSVQCNYKFSEPTLLQASGAAASPSIGGSTTPSLKSGSVLDALKNKFTAPSGPTKSPPYQTTTKTDSVVATPGQTKSPVAAPGTFGGFGNQFKKASSEWECDACMLRNKEGATKCVACETPRAAATTTKPTSSSSVTISSVSSSFGGQFKLAGGEWECDACMVRNKALSAKCVACETPRRAASTSTAGSSGGSAAQMPATTQSFGGFFKMPTGDWECDSCMVRNKSNAARCVACETPNKKTAITSSTNATAAAIPTGSSSFGDAFKPKANTWECPTCLIQNKSDASSCVACETRKPGGGVGALEKLPTTAAPTFKFGFAAAGVTSGFPKKPADAGFKALAVKQQAARWECEACMTRNDAARSKCVCCEQAKPGTQNSPDDDDDDENATPKFTFGASAAAKFSFGFAPTKPVESGTVPPTLTSATKLTEDAAPKGFVFGNAAPPLKAQTSTAPSGFTFGLKAASASPSGGVDTTDISKTAAGSGTPATTAAAPPASSTTALSGFKFGADVAAKPPTAAGFAFGSTPITTTSATSAAAATTAITTPSPTKINLLIASTAAAAATPTGAAVSSRTADESGSKAAAPSFAFGSTAPPATNVAGGFSFGSGPVKTATPPQDKSDAKASLAGGFVFKTPAATSAPSFSFGAPAPTTASTAGAAAAGTTTTTTSNAPAAVTGAKPMFSFGSSTAAGNPPVPGSITTTAKATTGGFAFGSSSSSAAIPSATRPLFGAAVTEPSPSAGGNKIFGSFGSAASGESSAVGFGSGSTATPLPMFGSPAAATPTSAFPTTATTTTSATGPANTPAATSAMPTFGSFGAAAQPTGVFGSFDGSSAATNQTGSGSLFGSNNNNNTNSNVTGASAPFVFGSSAANAAAAPPPTTTAAGATSTWPQNTFVFGAAPTQSSDPASAGAANKSVFGSFGGGVAGNPSAGQAQPQQQSAQPTSIFGVVASPTPAFGSGMQGGVFGSANATTNSQLGGQTHAGSIFGSAAQGHNNNGNSAANNNNNNNGSQQQMSAFGVAPGGAATAFGSVGGTTFGGTAATPFGAPSGQAAVPLFGGMSAQNAGAASFGGFGSSAGSGGVGAPANSSTDGASAAKKSEPAFNFGGGGASQANSGGFNFASSVGPVKAAFNFSAPSNTPSYNFSGTAAEQTNQIPIVKPYQFGATTTAPIFNFSGGAVEATANAPFQFSAGVAPASTNIFAPSPTPGISQQAQQARRKIRAPIRRMTPR